MSNSVYNSENKFNNFPKCLRKNFEELCSRSRLGLSTISLDDILLPKNPSMEQSLGNYHFILKIRYAGKRLKWDIIFDPEDLYFAPDFDFNDDSFLNDPELEIIEHNIPTLSTWDVENPLALTQLLNEFLSLYKKQQIEKLQKENIFSQCYDEYRLLLQENNAVEPENVEISIDGNTVNFVIAIKVDCSLLPKFCQFLSANQTSWINPGDDYVHLSISLKLDGTKANISLQLSPRLEQILEFSDGFGLPDRKNDITIAEYVAITSKILENRIMQIVENFRLKKIYVSCLVASMSQEMIEYDTESFNKVVFLYTLDDYECLVTIMLSPKFPQKRPTMILSSLYCQEGNCNKTFDNCPYNMNLVPEDNVERLQEFLEEAVTKFKSHKH